MGLLAILSLMLSLAQLIAPLALQRGGSLSKQWSDLSVSELSVFSGFLSYRCSRDLFFILKERRYDGDLLPVVVLARG